jgi:hypothetical protein
MLNCIQSKERKFVSIFKIIREKNAEVFQFRMIYSGKSCVEEIMWVKNILQLVCVRLLLFGKVSRYFLLFLDVYWPDFHRDRVGADRHFPLATLLFFTRKTGGAGKKKT